MILPSDRSRLRIAGEAEVPRYVINNYYGIKEPDDSRYERDYDLFHRIEVDGEVVLSVFRRKGPG